MIGTDDRVGESRLPYMKKNCCHTDWYKGILGWIILFQKVSNHLALLYPGKFHYSSFIT